MALKTCYLKRFICNQENGVKRVSNSILEAAQWLSLGYEIEMYAAMGENWKTVHGTVCDIKKNPTNKTYQFIYTTDGESYSVKGVYKREEKIKLEYFINDTMGTSTTDLLEVKYAIKFGHKVSAVGIVKNQNKEIEKKTSPLEKIDLSKKLMVTVSGSRYKF